LRALKDESKPLEAKEERLALRDLRERHEPIAVRHPCAATSSAVAMRARPAVLR
jgi:hypothetical protein